MIIGITGTLGSGKGSVVDYLVKNKGFKHYSVRDFLTEEIVRRGLPVNRDSMRLVGNDLREKNVPSYIVETLYKRAEKVGGNAVIESIRNIGEALWIKSQPNGYLLAVDADIKIRYDRITKRGSSTDNVSFEKFVEQENLEVNGNNGPQDMNIAGCMREADYHLNNAGSIEELHDQVEAVLAEIAKNNLCAQQK